MRVKRCLCVLLRRCRRPPARPVITMAWHGKSLIHGPNYRQSPLPPPSTPNYRLPRCPSSHCRPCSLLASANRVVSAGLGLQLISVHIPSHVAEPTRNPPQRRLRPSVADDEGADDGHTTPIQHVGVGLPVAAPQAHRLSNFIHLDAPISSPTASFQCSI